MEGEIRTGIEYARHDGAALIGDLYLPKGAGAHPVIVAVHGGGWQLGSRDSYRFWGPYLAARGHALFHQHLLLEALEIGHCSQRTSDEALDLLCASAGTSFGGFSRGAS